MPDPAESPCPQGRTDYEACFAPFRYCPVKGCGRAERDRQLPTEATPSDFEAGRRAATADIVAALRRQIEHHDPDASIAAVIWRDAGHLAQRYGVPDDPEATEHLRTQLIAITDAERQALNDAAHFIAASSDLPGAQGLAGTVLSVADRGGVNGT